MRETEELERQRCKRERSDRDRGVRESELHVAVCFQLFVYAIIKLTIKGTYTDVLLYEFVAQQPKKQTRGKKNSL